MIFIEMFVFSILLLFIVLLSGVVFSYISKEKAPLQIGKIIPKGFVLMLALFEVPFFLVVTLDKPFSWLYVSSILIFGLLILVAFYLIYTRKVTIKFRIINLRIIDILFVVAIIALAAYIGWKYYSPFDDGYYIAIANEAIENNRIILNDATAYTGDDFFAYTCTRPSINSFELLVAVLCKISNLHPAIAVHTVLPFIFTPIFVITAAQVLLPFSKSRNQLLFLVTIYVTISLLFDGSMQLVSPYFSVGTGNGKAILAYIIFPLVAEAGMNLVSEKHTLDMWISFAVLPIAATSATATGLYTIPIYYASFAAPYLFIRIIKNRKGLAKIIRNMIFCLLPLIPLGVYALLDISSTIETWSIQYKFNYMQLIKGIVKQSFIYLIMYFVALIILQIFSKKKKELSFFVYKFIGLCLLVYNPLTAGFIAKNITGNPVFDRLFYLNTVVLVIPIAVACLLNYVNNKKLGATVIIAFCCTIVANEFSDKLNTFTFYETEISHQNLYGLRNDVMEVCDYFDKTKPNEEIRLLGESSVNKFFRQYSARYHTVAGRHDIITEDNIGKLYTGTYDDLFNKKIITGKTMEGINYFDVDYLVTVEPLETNGFFSLKFVTVDSTIYVYEKELK